MAVAVPFIASAFGATALQSTLIAVAFSVTGISAKINKAAGKVFGDDLVNIANIFGAGYSIFNGGFDLGGTPDPNAMNVPTGSEAGDLFQSQMSAQGFEPVSIDTTNSVFDRVGLEPEALTNDAWEAAGAENTTALTESTGLDLNTGAATGVDSKVVADASVPATEAPQATGPQQPQGQGAAGQQATQQQGAAARATSQQAAGTSAAGAKAAATQPNLFEKLFYTTDKAGNSVINDRMVGGVLQGVGGAVGGYMTSQQQQRALDFQRQKYNTRPLGRIIN